MSYAPIHTEVRDGFDIAFYALPENTNPADWFDMESGDRTVELIKNGTYDWFIAKVTASKDGVELGDDYIGACCYNSASDFPKEEPVYYEDMVAEAIRAARARINAINA